jgi:hypothetical protein
MASWWPRPCAWPSPPPARRRSIACCARCGSGAPGSRGASPPPSVPSAPRCRSAPGASGRGWHPAPCKALVLPCGESTDGFSLATLVAVDVATTWTELQTIWGLHHRRVSSGIHLLRQRLPVPLRAWHSDNGSEFLNACLVTWCRREGIRFTRGRPYRKNDQAWVEQRNGLLVRRLVGYDRYSSRAAFAVLQRLYGLLRLQHNFFRPVRKLLSKRRLGSTVVKRYDAPRTPAQRMLLSGVLTEAQRQALDQQCLALDPIALARDIQQTLDLLWKLADTRPIRREAARG